MSDLLEKIQELKADIGEKYTIKEGILVKDSLGEFTVTDKLIDGNIVYIGNGKITVISNNPFIGLPYDMRYQNCVGLVASYLNTVQGSVDYIKLVKSIPIKKIIYYFNNPISPFLEELGFSLIALEDIKPNDIIVWQYNGLATSHIGAYLGENKLLHHIPNKLSCIDTIDLNSNKVLGIFRYVS